MPRVMSTQEVTASLRAASAAHTKGNVVAIHTPFRQRGLQDAEPGPHPGTAAAPENVREAAVEGPLPWGAPFSGVAPASPQIVAPVPAVARDLTLMATGYAIAIAMTAVGAIYVSNAAAAGWLVLEGAAFGAGVLGLVLAVMFAAAALLDSTHTAGRGGPQA